MSNYYSPKNSVSEQQKNSMLHSQKKTKNTKNNQLQQIILANQNFSDQYKGYYTITEWRKLNELLFHPDSYQQKTTITNCWRLMKLINFGDDIIPTGLIFDCIMTLMNVDQTIQQTEILLKAIFFKFIELNGKYLTEKQRQQLAFFRVVRNVVEGYRKIIADKLDVQNNNQDGQHDEKPHDRNEQLYLLHGVMTYKKDLGKLKKIQSQFKQCSFQPKINQYSAEIGTSRYKSASKKKVQSSQQIKTKHYGVIDESQQYSENFNRQQGFKAQPLPQYPDYDPPRQYLDHIERIRKSRQIRNINSLSRRSNVNAQNQQFSINERDELRKRNNVQNMKILFMIKVEVGKRIYRVKVRQYMGVNQTVRAIQKMVGFKSNEMVDVVKSYFINWQRRQKEKTHRQNNQAQQLSSDGI